MPGTPASPKMDEKVDRQLVTTPLKSGDPTIQYGTTDNDSNPPLFADQESRLQRLRKFACTLTMEPVMFCFMFGFVMNMSMMTNVMMDKGCLYHLRFPEEICRNRTAYPDAKERVEVVAANYSLYANLLSFVAAIFMNFIAPWSNKYGRKLPLLVAILGTFVTDLGYIVCVLYFESDLEYLILARLPSELCGGFICVLTIIYSHTSEVSSHKYRTLKYTLVELAFGLGLALGYTVGGVMYRFCGYVYIYMTIAALHVFCLLWVHFVVEETRGLDCTLSWWEKARDFFVCDHFITAVKTSFKRREHGLRTLILLLFASMCIVILTYESLSSIAYLYVYHIYSWDPTRYSMVMTVFMVGQMPVLIVLVPILIRVCKITDFKLGLIGVTSLLMKNGLFSVAGVNQYIYYAGMVLGILGPLATLSVRTGISKIIHKDELGSIFAFLATCEAVMPILGTVCVTKVYEATINSFPSVAYLMVSFMLILPMGTFIWAVCKSIEQYNIANPEDNKESISKP